MASQQANDASLDQVTFWNGEAGRQWVDRQAAWDITLAPVAEAAIARAAVKAGERVVDIGCGCGATSFELARRVGKGGHVLGIDISEPMLARAKERLSKDDPVEFVLADATTHPFKPEYDLLFSRFGVMFFPDPVAAFTNLRRALKPGGRMTFACFRSPRDNPFMMTALQAAYEHVPPLPKLGPDEPGPFSFADEERVRRILDEAGFGSITLEPHDLMLDVGSGRGLDEAVTNTLQIGPVTRALRGQPEAVLPKVEAAIRAVLSSHLRDNRIPLKAAIWLVSSVSQ
jgi:ubiquinone/menaquinone biosynthesis C-methylase UbiE